MKNSFGGLSSGLLTAEERLSELEALSVKAFQTENQREQGLKKIEENMQDCRTVTKAVHTVL